MLNMKKILIAGTVLTAFAASALAADVQESQPSKGERGSKIVRGDKNHRFNKTGEMRPGMHPPRLTDEERETFKGMSPEEKRAFMQQRHEEWVKNLSPEDKARYDEQQKLAEQRKEEHKKLAEEKMNKLSKEQRAEVEQFIKDDMAHRKAMGERLGKMTPEQREALHANHRGFGPGNGGDHHFKRGFGPKHDGEHHFGRGQQAPSQSSKMN